ncbi:Gll4071 protein [hydrothermal vent metagenome]|uniref:Gll4071 protein n=1 Tax=hydrothermal vent metagenome TaxID=652676 RepID=A0A3B0ZJY4_9ZZZZ
MSESPNLTEYLVQWRSGNKAALNKLMPLVYSSLRQLAGKYMYGENAGHTLQATALVNEAFMKLVDADITLQNRAHFMAISARAMRQILVDHARANRADKRGGDAIAITLHETRLGSGEQNEPDILEVEEALEQLNKIDSRKAQIIELSFYGGLTYDEIAEALDISAATVDRDLRFAKAWLYQNLKENQTSVQESVTD